MKGALLITHLVGGTVAQQADVDLKGSHLDKLR